MSLKIGDKVKLSEAYSAKVREAGVDMNDVDPEYRDCAGTVIGWPFDDDEFVDVRWPDGCRYAYSPDDLTKVLK